MNQSQVNSAISFRDYTAKPVAIEPSEKQARIQRALARAKANLAYLETLHACPTTDAVELNDWMQKAHEEIERLESMLEA